MPQAFCLCYTITSGSARGTLNFDRSGILLKQMAGISEIVEPLAGKSTDAAESRLGMFPAIDRRLNRA